MNEYDMTGAIFGRSQIRRRIVLLLLEGEAPRLHLREIQRRVGTTPGTARRELMRLVDAGVVKREAEGRNVYFRIDLDSPIAQPFRDLFRRTFGMPSVVRRHLRDLDGVDRAVVFGSYASGQMQPESDLDLLVVGSPDRDVLTDRLRAAEREIGRAINETVFTADELQKRRGRGDRFVAGIDAGPTISILDVAPSVPVRVGGDRAGLEYPRTMIQKGVLAEATRRLVGAYQPDRIYVYGSFARGEMTASSDIDVLVVVPDQASPDRRRSAAGYAALAGLDAPFDIGVVTRSWFDGRTHLRASLPGAVMRDGRLLYAA